MRLSLEILGVNVDAAEIDEINLSTGKAAVCEERL